MASPFEMLTHKTRANHFKRRLAMGGHLWLDEGTTPALVFRAHGFFQRRYELRLPLADIQSSSGWTIKMKDGTTERFVVASGTGLAEAMAAARLPRMGGQEPFMSFGESSRTRMPTQPPRVARRRLAEDPQTPARTLAELARECQDDPHVHTLIARNPNTSGQTLTELAASSYFEVRRAVAENLRTPTTVLDRFVRDRVERFHDDSWRRTSTSTLVVFINREVAKNPNTSPETLRLLEDHHEEVGGNPNAAADSLVTIAEYALAPNKYEYPDADYFAEWEFQGRAMRALAGNPSTPQKVLEALADTGAVDLVAGNPNASAALLLKIATGPCDWGGDEEDKPHRALATNPSTSPEAISILVEAHPRDADFYASRGERRPQ